MLSVQLSNTEVNIVQCAVRRSHGADASECVTSQTNGNLDNVSGRSLPRCPQRLYTVPTVQSARLAFMLQTSDARAAGHVVKMQTRGPVHQSLLSSKTLMELDGVSH